MWMLTTWHCVEHTVQCRENIWQVPSNYQHSSLNLQVVTVDAQRCSYCQAVCTHYMLQLGQIPSSIMLYLPQLCFKSQQHWILASVDFLLLCLLVTVFRHSGMSQASRTTAVVQSVPAKERLTTWKLLHCTLHHVVQNSTISKKLWLWYYGFHGYKRGEGAAQLRVLWPTT